MLPNTIRFMRQLGFEFHLDWDGELEIEYPLDLTPGQIAQALLSHDREIACVVKRQAACDREQCVGGPFNGRRHEWLRGNLEGLRVKRGCWAVYLVVPDGRAFFQGFASSEKKARQGELCCKRKKT